MYRHSLSPGGPGPRFCGFLNISALHVQYGFQAFARFKRPECTRLHLRELQSQIFSRRSVRPKLPRKVRRSQSWWALSRPYCHCIIYQGPLYHKILRPSLNTKWSKVQGCCPFRKKLENYWRNSLTIIIWNSISLIEFNQTSIQNDGSKLFGRPLNLQSRYPLDRFLSGG